jgi:iron complex transport system ATP-binding protein
LAVTARGWLARVGRARHRGLPPTTSEPGGVALRAAAVTVRIGARSVLDQVDLTVRHGEVVALVGPNGAGKSTLLAVLAGDRVPTSGAVHLQGAAVDTWTTRELAMRRAVLVQQSAVSFSFTVEETVRMGRFVWGGVDPAADDAHVASAMAATEVAHLAHRDVTSLSGGERARAAMARVLAQDATVMLLDEPTAALDLRHQEQLLELARGRAEVGVAVVVVLHDLGLAAAHADRVVVLADGSVRSDGPPSEVLSPRLLGEVYDWPVEVVAHPVTGAPLVLPLRRVHGVKSKTSN